MSVSLSAEKIVVGSQNQVKLEAVKEMLSDYSEFKMLDVEGVRVDSGVSEQPLSLEETIRGAKTRANLAFQDCKYSIGLESGIMHLPESEEKYMDICICAIYDGLRYHIGTSCGYRLPN